MAYANFSRHRHHLESFNRSILKYKNLPPETKTNSTTTSANKVQKVDVSYPFFNFYDYDGRNYCSHFQKSQELTQNNGTLLPCTSTNESFFKLPNFMPTQFEVNGVPPMNYSHYCHLANAEMTDPSSVDRFPSNTCDTVLLDSLLEKEKTF